MSDIAQTADHALRILEELGKVQPLTPAQLCERLELNRTVVHRLLNTLAARGFVLRQGSGYNLGVALVQLAQTIEPNLREVAAPIVEALAREVNETVVLHVVDGDQAVVLEQAVATEHVVQVSHRIGSRHSLVEGASGRAMLAFLPRQSVARALKGVQQQNSLQRELDEVRLQGHAVSHDELQSGVHGVAVPILGSHGEGVGSLAVLIPSVRARDIGRHVEVLRKAAAKIRSGQGFDTP